MNVQTIIGLIIGGGIVLYMIGFIIWAYLIKPLRKPSEYVDEDPKIKEIKVWIKDSIESGQPKKESIKQLVQRGFGKALIKKLYKKTKEEMIEDVKRKKVSKLPKTNGKAEESIKTDRGRSDADEGRRDGKVKHKRVLPISKVKSLRRNKRKPKRDWNCFK